MNTKSENKTLKKKKKKDLHWAVKWGRNQTGILLFLSRRFSETCIATRVHLDWSWSLVGEKLFSNNGFSLLFSLPTKPPLAPQQHHLLGPGFHALWRLPHPVALLQHVHLASCWCYSERQVCKAKVCPRDSSCTGNTVASVSGSEKRNHGSYREIGRLTLAWCGSWGYQHLPEQLHRKQISTVRSRGLVSLSKRSCRKCTDI